MQNDGIHNGQRKTRKDFRKEKANKNRKGLVTPDVKFYAIRVLVAGVFEVIKALYESKA